ncbi:MAG TPA: hypothetical protein VHC92_00290 [Rhodanobacteraceae bacterium]|jgi:hypothetical protein|nr:hypothetical protein [Rhodanobacteraceae bacterium]
MKTIVAIVFTAILAGVSTQAWACGACVEDKVAATYDYAVVQHAMARGDVVVFCDVRGELDADRLRKAVRKLGGVDAASIRVSTAPQAVSFALDTAKQSIDDAAAALRRGAGGLEIEVVKTIRESSREGNS